MSEVIGFDEGGYYTDEGYLSPEELTTTQLQNWFDELGKNIWSRLEPYYTLEDNPIPRILSVDRELRRREEEQNAKQDKR